MATLPTQNVAPLLGALLIAAAPIADTPVALAAPAPAVITSSQDANDPDTEPAPLIQEPPEVQGPSNPGQKTLAPQHHRSHHRPPNTH